MKTITKILFAFFIIASPMIANASPDDGAALKKVEAQYVCMINNKLFDRTQIPVSVEGKTYYGCCPMCETKLKQSKQARMAVDPVSGNDVDKALAVIGAQADGAVFYFENEENLKKYGNHEHSDAKQCMQGEDCPMHEGMKHPGKDDSHKKHMDKMHDHKEGMHGGGHGHEGSDDHKH